MQHLHKQGCLLVGDEVWFKSYTLSRKRNQFQTNASNLYVRLFDPAGQAFTKMYYTENGLGSGSFFIDST